MEIAEFYLINEHVYELMEIDNNNVAKLIYWEWIHENDAMNVELDISMPVSELQKIQKLTHEEVEERMYQ